MLPPGQPALRLDGDTREDPNPQEIAKAHRLAWNMGQAPLLFVVIPGEVRVYSTYERPRRKAAGLDEEAGLIDVIDFISGAEHRRGMLAKYSRQQLQTGQFWVNNRQRFDRRKHVEKTLLDNLCEIRSLMMQDLDAPLVHSLLGRAIFVQYLQDRKDSRGCRAFPEGFFESYLAGASGFADVLKDRRATYDLFRFLERKFNGDIFPVNCTVQDP